MYYKSCEVHSVLFICMLPPDYGVDYSSLDNKFWRNHSRMKTHLCLNVHCFPVILCLRVELCIRFTSSILWCLLVLSFSRSYLHSHMLELSQVKSPCHF